MKAVGIHDLTRAIMDVPAVHSDDVLDPPARIFERLRLIAGYSWDDSKAPFHSSYDNW